MVTYKDKASLVNKWFNLYNDEHETHDEMMRLNPLAVNLYCVFSHKLEWYRIDCSV